MDPRERPTFSAQDAQQLALERYGLRAVATPLPSERDQNVKLSAAHGAFVLKIAHPREARATLEAQHHALKRLAELPRKVFPAVVKALSGDTLLQAEHGGREHLVWLTPYFSGAPLAHLVTLSPALLSDIGTLTAQMDRALFSFGAPALHRDFRWAAQSAPERVLKMLEHHRDAAQRKLVEDVLATFSQHVEPQQLRLSVVHNDLNDHNVLASGERVTAFLDFGDMHVSYTLCDLAHACCYLMLGKDDPLALAEHVARAYQRTFPLLEAELGALYDFIRLRLALSVTMSAFQQRLEPENTYLSVSERPAWRLLAHLATLDASEVRQRFVNVQKEAIREQPTS